MKREEIIAAITEGFNHTDVSLRQFALSTGTTYQVLLRESRKPIKGVPYDPDAINFEAIADAVIRKCGSDVELPDFSTLKSSRKTAGGSTTKEWNVGDVVEFRNFEGTYKILMTTEDHVVFMELGSTKPRVMNRDTFEHQGPRSGKEGE